MGKPASSTGTSASGHIDWIFYRNGEDMHLQSLRSRTITSALRGKKTLSDHHPVVVTFGIRNAGGGSRKRARSPNASSEPGAEVLHGAKRPSAEVALPGDVAAERRQVWERLHGYNAYRGNGGTWMSGESDDTSRQ